MKIACLADVHGNIHALEPILEQMENVKYDLMICCGDMIGLGPFPNEVVEFLRIEGFQMLLGNCEQSLLLGGLEIGTNPRPDDTWRRSLQWTANELSSENRAFLRKVPTRLEVNGDGPISLLACHASPDSLTEGLYEATREERFIQLAAKQEAGLVAFGHTHVGFQKVVAGVRFVNCGSVGRSADGDTRACYASIETEKNGGEMHAEVVLRRVKYDVETAAKAVVRRGLPRELADSLREGR